MSSENPRRERMTLLLSDCFAAVQQAAQGRQLDGEEFQALVSTLYIQEGRIEETRLRYPSRASKASGPPEPIWEGIDTGPHQPGTREAQQYVAAQKIKDLENGAKKPPASTHHRTPETAILDPNEARPWKNAQERDRVFAQLREQLGEVRYFEELDKVGVPNPALITHWPELLGFYRKLATIAIQEREAA